MDTNVVANVVIGLAVLGLLLYRQLTPRVIKTDGGGRLLLILAAVGLIQLAQFVQTSGWAGGFGVGMLLVSFVLAAVFATVRAYSVRVWQAADGAWWRRGNALTLVLWVLSIGSHFGVDVLVVNLAGPGSNVQGLGNASLVLYIAVSLGLQNLLVARRVSERTRNGQIVGR